MHAFYYIIILYALEAGCCESTFRSGFSGGMGLDKHDEVHHKTVHHKTLHRGSIGTSQDTSPWKYHLQMTVVRHSCRGMINECNSASRNYIKLIMHSLYDA